jgi:hypothetical protein
MTAEEIPAERRAEALRKGITAEASPVPATVIRLRLPIRIRRRLAQ